MFISPMEAVKMYNVSKPTLYKDMSEGKLPHNKDDRNRRKINVAELDRLYQKRQEVPADLTSRNVNPDQGLTGLNVNNQQLEENREEHRGYLRLLENKSEKQGAQTSKLDQILQFMQHQINTLESREEERKKRSEERRQKREAEKMREQQKSKGFFNRLLGIAGQGA